MDATSKGPERKESNQLEFLTFFITAGTAAAALAGFAYTNEFFHAFGISLFEHDISYIKIIASAGYLLQDKWVLFGSIAVVMLFSIVVTFSRYFFGNLGFYVTATLLFLLGCYCAVLVGNSKADEHSKAIINGESGRVVYCKLRDKIDDLNNGKFPKEFKQSFNKVSDEDDMVKIFETRESIYLFNVPPDNVQLPENYHGRSINIRKADLLYCIVMGT